MKQKIVRGGLAAVLMFGTLAATPMVANAAQGDGALTVNVIKDVNANGAWDAVLEGGIAQTTVRVTDAFGGVSEQQTDKAGKVVVNTAALQGGKYRIEVINPNPDVYSSATASANHDTPSASRLSSTEEFVDVSNGAAKTVTTGYWIPGEYCQSNPTVAMACQTGMNAWGTDFLTGKGTLFTMPYQFTSSTNPAFFSNSDVTGAVYGIGVQQRLNDAGKTDHRIFAGAYAKRASQYSVNGAGAIFVQDRGSANAPVTLFGTVPNAGTATHSNINQDINFVPVVGKQGLGDIDVSADGRALFVVNMADKKLYVYDANDTSGAAQALTALDIPNPGCGSEWRPMGIGERAGLLYVGGVCDQALTAHVTTLDIESLTWTNDWPMSNQSLAYERGHNQMENGSCASANWNRWADALPAVCADVLFSPQRVWAQPMLADIEFRNDGAMMASFRDRTGDQYGAALYARTSAGGFSIPYVVASGDLLLACDSGSGYRLDVQGGCGTSGEFFAQDSRIPYFGTHVHQESYYGGIGYVASEKSLITNAIDPEDTAYSSGITRITVDGSSQTEANQALIPLSGTDPLGGFGKGQGLADIEALCDLAPVQIGNRVWFDRDRDGTQGAGETSLAGVTVQLIKDGAVIGSRTTDANGEYYFSSADSDLGGKFVPNGGEYTVKFIAPTTGQVNLGGAEGTVNWSSLSFTAQGAGGNDRLDSNPNPATGEYSFSVGGPGRNDHTLDAGFVVKSSGPEYSKTSSPASGTVVHQGDVITYTIKAVNNGGTAVTAATLTDDLASVLDKATMETGAQQPTLKCSGGGAAATCGVLTYDPATYTLVWKATSAKPLSAGTTATITYSVKVNPYAYGDITNRLVEPGITTTHPIK